MAFITVLGKRSGLKPSGPLRKKPKLNASVERRSPNSDPTTSPAVWRVSEPCNCASATACRQAVTVIWLSRLQRRDSSVGGRYLEGISAPRWRDKLSVGKPVIGQIAVVFVLSTLASKLRPPIPKGLIEPTPVITARQGEGAVIFYLSRPKKLDKHCHAGEDMPDGPRISIEKKSHHTTPSNDVLKEVSRL
jgi:hypothetical protein